MNRMNEVQTFLKEHWELVVNHVGQLDDFISSPDIVSISNDFKEAKAAKPQLGFNVFRLTSDFYSRENFHSDILSAFLDAQGNHGESNRFLDVLIDLLNKHYPRTTRINKRHYLDSKSEREPGRIDILISSEKSRRCIIIENKINGAADMHRQLPRYYDMMTEQGYTIDAIVYLPLDWSKSPDMSSWSANDKAHVLPLLCPLPAYAPDGRVNLVDHWIQPCVCLTGSEDCRVILRQYGELVKSLNINNMDSIIVSKFYENLLKGDNLSSAISINNMLEDVPSLMSDRLLESFKAELDSFGPWRWSGHPTHCGLLFNVGKRRYKIDVYTSLDGYDMEVFDEGDSERDVPWLGNVKCHGFVKTDRYRKHFSFYEEEAVKECVNNLISKFKKYEKR